MGSGGEWWVGRFGRGRKEKEGRPKKRMKKLMEQNRGQEKL